MHRILCTSSCLLLTLGGAVCGPLNGQPATVADRSDERGTDLPANAPEAVRGYGLSVFEGDEPERFEVEVLGEFGGVAVGDDYILARLTGAGLEDTGVIAGMSGSPVYVDGELIGAIAFAWPFADEAIGGITPIGSMRRQLLAGASTVTRHAGVTWSELFDLSSPEERLRQWAHRLLPQSSTEARVSLQLASSGLPESARAWLSGVVGDLAPAGSSAVELPLAPGSAVAGVLVDGDWRLAVTGTVTDVDGDRILAFGHPFLGNGATDLPMAPAEVVSVVSSQFVSFKVTNFGEPVGRFDEDRSTGVRGVRGEVASMVPIEIALQPAAENYSMRLARVPELLPLLVGLSVFQSTAAGGYLAGTYGLDLEATFDLGDQGDLTLDVVYDGPTAAVAAALQLIQYTDFLHNNPWQEVEVEGVTISLRQSPQPISLQVLGAKVDRGLLEPGERVDATVRLKSYRRPVEERRFTFDLPDDLDPGVYQLLIGDAQSVDLARWVATGEQPESFDQALRLLRGLRSADSLAIVGLRQKFGVAVDGASLPGLPPSIARLVASGAEARPVAWHFESLLSQASEQPLSGVVRVPVEVVERRRSNGDEQESNG